MNGKTAGLKALILQLDLSGREYTAGQVVDAYRTAADDEGRLRGFVQALTCQLRLVGKVRWPRPTPLPPTASSAFSARTRTRISMRWTMP